MKRLVLLVFFFLALSYQRVFAATLTIQNTPATINQSDEFSADISLSCSGCGDSYLRGVFYDSGTSYFGYTQDNNGNFSNAPGSSCTTFFKIAQSDLISGSWSGKIKFKPDPASPNFNGSGEYSFKVGRYTSSCSSPSVWSNDVVISVIGPSFTPTSAPSAGYTSTPTKLPTLSPASVNISQLPKITSKAVKSASTLGSINKEISTMSSKNNLNISPTKEDRKSETEVAGETGSNKNKLIVTIILLVGGILFIIAAGLLFKKYQSQIMEWINS